MSWHRAAHLVQSAVLVAIVADILWLMTRKRGPAPRSVELEEG